MANTKFLIRGKANPATIYIRFTANRQTDFKVSTPLTINPKYFNNKTGKVRKVANYKGRNAMELQLNELSNFILEQYNTDLKSGKVSGSGWLRMCVNNFFNVADKNDLRFLSKYAVHYIEKLKIKRNDKTGEIGVSNATLSKYTTIKNKIESFEKNKRKKYRLTEVNIKFRNDFLTYLLDVEQLGRNTCGRYLKFLKTICLDAQKSGYKVSPELSQIKGFTVKVKKIFLSFDELDKIERLHLVDKTLSDARDWLLLGCYIGQRVGDLLSLTSENIKQNGNLSFIELEQQKTSKKVSILIYPKVREILERHGGDFPKVYKGLKLDSAKTKFNLHIKEVCRLAELAETVSGAKVNPKTNRKESGDFPKYELITSHICRRSFASNYFGEIPTALIMNVTGHATEREFLNYIGKTNIDYAEQMAKYWNMESQKQAIKDGAQTPLKIAK